VRYFFAGGFHSEAKLSRLQKSSQEWLVKFSHGAAERMQKESQNRAPSSQSCVAAAMPW